MHRRASDHWFAALRREPALRFQCRSTACGWSGLLAPNAAAATERRRPLVAGALMVLFVAVAAVGLVAVTSDRWGSDSDAEPASAQDLADLRPLPRNAGVPVPPAGWHDVGQALPSDDARLAGRVAGLQIRHGCTWGVPGRDPYRGSAEQALQAAGLPDDAVRTIAQRIRRGESDGEVTLARDGIRSADGQRQFGRRLVASTYGMTLCFDTLVNFEDGHVERAPLFEFTAADGRRFSVIVPEVCGNVGVIAEQPAAGIVLGERAERSAGPAAPGIAGPLPSPGAPLQNGSAGGRMLAAAPPAGGGGRSALPAPPVTGGGRGASPGSASPPQTTSPTTPVGPTPPAEPGSPLTPPPDVPDPGAQPPGSGSTPPTPDTRPPQPPQPPVGPSPPADPEPPITPPAGNPGPGTPPPGNGGTPPEPPPSTPPQSPQPPAGPPPPGNSGPPPLTPPTGDPGPGTPPPGNDGTPPQPPPSTPPQPPQPPVGPIPPVPDLPPQTPTTDPEDPETPPPTDPTPWLPGPDWPPPIEPPGIFPGDQEPPRQVPAPGTLSTGLLGLAALMISRRWRRRRHG